MIYLVEVFELFQFCSSLIFFTPQWLTRTTHRQYFDLLLTAWFVGSACRLHLVNELDISQQRIIILKLGQHVLRAFGDWLLRSFEEDVIDWLLLGGRLGRHRQSLNLHLNHIAMLGDWGLWLVDVGAEHDRLQHFRWLLAPVAKRELADWWTWFHLGERACLVVW